MNVRNCRKCGRIFNYIVGAPVCPACREAQEELYEKVKNYIRENKGSNIHKVSEECEVEVSLLQQWVREERLEFAEGAATGINCEKCGAVIRSGRYCDRCKAEMVNGLNSMYQPAKPQVQQETSTKDSPKMRFLK